MRKTFILTLIVIAVFPFLTKQINAETASYACGEEDGTVNISADPSSNIELNVTAEDLPPFASWSAYNYVGIVERRSSNGNWENVSGEIDLEKDGGNFTYPTGVNGLLQGNWRVKIVKVCNGIGGTRCDVCTVGENFEVEPYSTEPIETQSGGGTLSCREGTLTVNPTEDSSGERGLNIDWSKFDCATCNYIGRVVNSSGTTSGVFMGDQSSSGSTRIAPLGDDTYEVKVYDEVQEICAITDLIIEEGQTPIPPSPTPEPQPDPLDPEPAPIEGMTNPYTERVCKDKILGPVDNFDEQIIRARTVYYEENNSLILEYGVENLENSKYDVALIHPDGTKETIEAIKDFGQTHTSYTGRYTLNNPAGEYKLSLIRYMGGTQGLVKFSCDTERFLVDPSNPAEEVPIGGSSSNPYGSTGPGGGSVIPGANQDINEGTARLVQWFYQLILPFAVVIAIIRLLIYLAILAASQGDPQKLNDAKENITSTLIGLLVIGGAATLISILGNALGV